MPLNYAYSTVATAPSPATSGTSLVVAAGDGALFPPVPFPASVWPTATRPLAANAEVVLVTGVSTDTLTIVRAQEGSTARSIIVGDQIAATGTANLLAQNNVFTSDSPTVQDIKLTAASEYVAPEVVNVGSAFQLEIPSDSSLEPLTYSSVYTQTGTIAHFGTSEFDHIESGCVWRGDTYAVNNNASMTSGFVWISGKRLSVAQVNSRAFTASKDTYVDFTDAGNGTATITYTEVTNNAASPALAASGVRNAIIVTGASSIAAATSVNQGQETMILPIASSIAYSVTDSLGNLICPRDPQRKTLGYRQITANATASTIAQITGLTCPVIVPTGRKIKISASSLFVSNSGTSSSFVSIWDGVVNSGPQLSESQMTSATAGNGYVAPVVAFTTPTSSSKTYNAGLRGAANTATFGCSSVAPGFILVELA